MIIAVFDTETISIGKPFCYNVGYIITDTENDNILTKKDFVVEQIWHNLPLFETAYYKEKKDIYIKRMRGKKAIMSKYGYICQEMKRDFNKYGVEIAFAFNSGFDENVFNFNCNWYKNINPFDNIPIKDIRAFVHYFMVDDNFKAFCDKHSLFTDSGNYSTTAETMYKYITKNVDFEEEHTALQDSLIEWEILKECIKKGANLQDNYIAKKSIARTQPQVLTIRTEKKDFLFNCNGYTVYKKKNLIKLK